MTPTAQGKAAVHSPKLTAAFQTSYTARRGEQGKCATESEPLEVLRRHMTASRRAAAVVACSAWVPRGRPGKPETISGLSRDSDMAKAAGTSDRTIRDANAFQAGTACPVWAESVARLPARSGGSWRGK